MSEDYILSFQKDEPFFGLEKEIISGQLSRALPGPIRLKGYLDMDEPSCRWRVPRQGLVWERSCLKIRLSLPLGSSV